MSDNSRHTLICTIGTSLFHPNLERLATGGNIASSVPASVRDDLIQAYRANDCPRIASQLHHFAPTDRLCGAEINSVTDLLAGSHVEKGHLHLLHSDTTDGDHIAAVLKAYFTVDEWIVDVHRIDELKDDDPRAFRTRGLRNLAKTFGERVREAGVGYCAINATGGYKAQIAIAVLMGQALGIPVYYKHERFPAIIPFPPMPISLDFTLWQRASGMFAALSRPDACEPETRFSEDWDERFEPLINRVPVDGTICLELSATGQIFHETFRTRFQDSTTTGLPRPAMPEEKQTPRLGKHGYKSAEEPIRRYLSTLTDQRPYVKYCHSTYWNPDLPETPRFRVAGGKVEGIFSDGSWCVKFGVVTTAEDDAALSAVVADLNCRLPT